MIRRLSLSLAACLALAVCAADAEPYRSIDVPQQEHGYQNFESKVIKTQAELDAFLKNPGEAWNERKKFEEGLKAPKIDFEKEALVLLRHTEGSGSVQVTFEKPKLEGTTLKCKVSRKEPEIGTADMAYYTFALVVDKTKVKKVEFTSAGKTVELKLD
ncbi:MAG TPA: hypothetical protein VEJ63_17480 [Planctomycetota bacterium]|nr:hypothetical protein [Planctomycetota bacterium]